MNGFSTLANLGTELLALVSQPHWHGVGAFVIALTFLVSGLAKLRRPDLAGMALVDFGIARRASPSLGATLGGSEVLLAIAVALPATREFGLICAAGVLSSFVVLLFRALHAGGRFPCFCFGDASERLSVWSVVRSLGLALLAAVAALPTQPVVSAQSTALQLVTSLAILGTAAVVMRLRELYPPTPRGRTTAGST